MAVRKAWRLIIAYRIPSSADKAPFPFLPLWFSVLLLISFFFGGCVSLKPRPAIYVEEGLASWYGPDFHGRPTSSREIFDMNEMTAAHPTLPFGTYVVVTNLNNGRSAVVRINDRGPFVTGRIIDLSYAAARVLEAVGPGVIPVRLEVLGKISPPSTVPNYYVQVGAFALESNARALFDQLKPKYPNVFISTFSTPQAVYYRVRIRAADRDQAMRIAQVLSEAGQAVLIIEE
jgi:rare lipoprotein A